ncbi:hypothetical protein C8F01DRAFT_1177767 [Mycena amicta]|nr:hypothetical protein C8F01DRAFT_1177767 [Mycena amicta]
MLSPVEASYLTANDSAHRLGLPLPLPLQHLTGSMASAEHGTTITDSRKRRRRPQLRFPPLVFEFGVTVVLSFLILLAILYTLEYHIRLFLSTQSTPSPCAESLLSTLSALSPLDVLKVTSGCAALVFAAIECIARISSRGKRATARDVEAAAGSEYLPRSDAKTETATETSRQI